jgi:hypothetical protein
MSQVVGGWMCSHRILVSFHSVKCVLVLCKHNSLFADIFFPNTRIQPAFRSGGIKLIIVLFHSVVAINKSHPYVPTLITFYIYLEECSIEVARSH